MEKEPTVTFRYINGTDYLYWVIYDPEASAQKRQQLRDNGASPTEISNRGSVFTQKSIGKWDLNNPCKKLVQFLKNQPDDFIKELDERFHTRERERFAKRMEKIKKEKALQSN